MSILRSRIVGQMFNSQPEYTHPHGTDATPMIMPLALVDYGGAGATYQDLHFVPATAEPNAVPFPSVANGSFGMVVPAGRP